MRALLQRVSGASVSIEGRHHSSINAGLLIFLGIKNGDTESDGQYLAEKCASIRIFEDEEGKMNRSVKETGGSVMVVSQFTLYGDTRKGNRPGFSDAARPDVAEPLYENFVASLKTLLGDEKVSTGVFRAMMDISMVNNGPVTVIIESK